ncbi:thioredoxin-like 1-1, chloroplastic [Vigna umbellata]|uniref:thioredoxin-like 1-1, chloroplastic n=1 Tax=Vigna umbellata TaxID=87088 RepID=UPI001F5FD629|nr:thioredoxin-like 1-1, chloroplastic [Vigna umbellata]
MAINHPTTTVRRVSAMITLLPLISASLHRSRPLNNNSTLSTHTPSPQLYTSICHHLWIKFCSGTLFFFRVFLFLLLLLSQIETQVFLVCSFVVVSEAKENLMAEVLTKASLVSSWHGSSQRHHRRVSMVPNSCSFVSDVGRFPSLKLKSQILRSWSSSSEFQGKKLLFHLNRAIPNRVSSRLRASTATQMTHRIGKVQKWWEKGLQPNMKEVTSAQDLVESLLSAGDKLVVVDFFSPGCGGCRALHPKICQLAEMNPDVQFLQVNYEEQKSMCYSLNVHVLPFFRFYRGAEGRLCSFSCTNATIKKFKDALAKHSSDRCSLGPTKGLEEKELLALAANKDLSFTFSPNPLQPEHADEDMATASTPVLSSESLHSLTLISEVSREKTLATAGR